MRYLAIDYGDKRVGIAVTDPLKMFTIPFATIENKSDKYVFTELLNLLKSQKVERIIVGLPLNVEGGDSIKTKEVREFYQKLTQQTDLPLYWWDERYSTCEANDFLKQKGISWKDSKDKVDQIAAAVILKSYLDSNQV